MNNELDVVPEPPIENPPAKAPKSLRFYEGLKASGVVRGLPEDPTVFLDDMADDAKRQKLYNGLINSGKAKGLPSYEEFSGLFSDAAVQMPDDERGALIADNKALMEAMAKGIPTKAAADVVFNRLHENGAKLGLTPEQVDEELNLISEKGVDGFNAPSTSDVLDSDGKGTSGTLAPGQSVPGDTGQGRFMSAANTFSEMFVRPFSADLLRNFAIGGSKVGNALGLTEGKVEDTPVYKYAEQLSKDLDELFPENPKYQDEFLTKKFPAGLASGMSMLVGGAVSKLPRVATGVSMALGSSSMAANEFVEAKESGATDDEAFTMWLTGAALGPTDGIPIAKVFKRLDTATGGGVTSVISKKVTGKAGKFITEAIGGGFEELIQEVFLQQIPTNFIASKVYDETRSVFEGTVDAGTVGFSVGLVLNGLGLSLNTLKKSAKSQADLDAIARAEEFLEQKRKEHGVEEVTGDELGVKGEQPVVGEGTSGRLRQDGEQASPDGKVIEGEIVSGTSGQDGIGFTFNPVDAPAAQLEQLAAERTRLEADRAARESSPDGLSEADAKSFDAALEGLSSQVKSIETAQLLPEALENEYVNYEGVNGVLTRNDAGYWVVADNGEPVLVESGLSGKPIGELGIKPAERAPVQAEPEGSDFVDETSFVYNPSDGAIQLYGKEFVYDGVEVDGDNTTTAIRVKDKDGAVKYIRNEDVVLEIEIQKELWEYDNAFGITEEQIAAAAERIGAKPKVAAENTSVEKPAAVREEGSVENIEGVEGEQVVVGEEVQPAVVEEGSKKSEGSSQNEEGPSGRLRQEGVTADDFDYSKLGTMTEQEFKQAQIAEEQEQLDKRRKAFLENDNFSKEYAPTYDEAIERAKKEYLEAKAEKEKWEGKEYKKSKGVVDFGDGETKSHNAINEGRRDKTIKLQAQYMEEALSTLSEAGMPKAERDAFIKSTKETQDVSSKKKDTSETGSAVGATIEQRALGVKTKLQHTQQGSEGLYYAAYLVPEMKLGNTITMPDGDTSFEISNKNTKVIGRVKNVDFSGEKPSTTRGEVFILESKDKGKGNGQDIMLEALYLMRMNDVSTVKFTVPSKEGRPFNDSLENKGYIKKIKEDAKTGTAEYAIEDKVVEEKYHEKINQITTATEGVSTTVNEGLEPQDVSGKKVDTSGRLRQEGEAIEVDGMVIDDTAKPALDDVTVRSVAEDSDGTMDYTVPLLLSGLDKGDSFKVGDKTWTLVAKTKNPTTKKYNKGDGKFKGSYKLTTYSLKADDGSKLQIKAWNDWVADGVKMQGKIIGGEKLSSFTRDVQGQLTVDLINDNNTFHTKSDVYALVEKGVELHKEKIKSQDVEESSKNEGTSGRLRQEGKAARPGNFVEMAVADIETDVDRFQNRERAFSEDTAAGIVADVRSGDLDVANIPPVLVWMDPKDGKNYIVGGHSRIEAFKRLGVETIPVQLLQGLSEAQAIKRGREDNALGTSETLVEQANIVRGWVQDTPDISMAERVRKAKALFKHDYRKVLALSALDPKGKAIATVNQLQKNQGDDSAKAITFAKYVGEVRLKYPELTNSHEKELFDYLLAHDNVYTKNERSFMGLADDVIGRNTFLGEFDASKPLNIERAQPKTAEELAYDTATKELEKEVNDASDNLKGRIKEIEERKAKGEKIDDALAEKSIARFKNELTVATRRLLEHKKKKGEVEKAKQSQTAMFKDRAHPEGGESVTFKEELGEKGKIPKGKDAAKVDGAQLIEVIDSKGRQRTIELSDLDEIHGMAMPELVRLVKELTGTVPGISTRFTTTRGVFYPVGDGRIALAAHIFKNTKLATQVLAHEIGHLVDYLPDKSMARGNILGRILTLRNHLKTTAEGSETIGEPLTDKDRRDLRSQAQKAVLAERGVKLSEYIANRAEQTEVTKAIKERYQEYIAQEIENRKLLSNKEFFDELYAHSKYWRPFDEAMADPDFIMYRRSSPELYADALSALLVSPGTLQRTAPKFYKEWFAQIDAKPEFKQQYLEMQAYLNGGDMAVQRLRDADVKAAFLEGEAKTLELIEERKKRAKSFKDGFFQDLVNRYHPVTKKVTNLIKEGEVIPDNKNPLYLLEELDFKDNEATLYLHDVGTKVIQPIEDAGLTTLELHKYLLFNRIANEGKTQFVPESEAAKEFLEESNKALDEERQEYGRAFMANPGGLTSETALEQLDLLRMDIGNENYELLTQKAKTFQELNFGVIEKAVEAGTYNKELFEEVIEPNKYNYATFSVLDYIQYPDYVNAGIKAGRGTFKDVGSTFDATLLKTISLIHLNHVQIATKGFVDTWFDHFPGEISKAKQKSPGNFIKEPGMGHIRLLENGKLVKYNVDAYIAEAFDFLPKEPFKQVVNVVRWFNESVYRPLFITYNPAFIFWSNPLRDFRRAYKNTPEVGFGELVKAYVNNWQDAKDYSKGRLENPRIRALIDNYSITPPGDGKMFKERGDALGRQMERFHLIDGDKNWVMKKMEQTRGVRAIPALMEWMRTSGNIVEILPKLAVEQVLREKGVSGKELSFRLRNKVGTPNFKAGGVYKSTTNGIWMFSNIITQGYKADINTSKAPSTAGAFWFRTAMIDVLPKLLIRMALLGWLGEELKEFYNRVTEYDKTNYNVIPLGTSEGGASGTKSNYLRVPQDETGRLVSGLVWKLSGLLAEDKLAQPGQIFDIGADELPSMAPVITTMTKWMDYLAGGNPIDDWRDRPILPQRVQDARPVNSKPALKKMVQWTINQTGITSIATYNPNAEGWDEIIMQSTPILNRMIKSTDYGLSEMQSAEKAMENAVKQATRLGYGDEVLNMVSRANYLRGLGDKRTTKQSTEYAFLNEYYQKAYLPFDSEIRAALEVDKKGLANTYIKDLKKYAKIYSDLIKDLK